MDGLYAKHPVSLFDAFLNHPYISYIYIYIWHAVKKCPNRWPCCVAGCLMGYVVGLIRQTNCHLHAMLPSRLSCSQRQHDGVMAWERFPHYWSSVKASHWSQVDSCHKWTVIRICLICLSEQSILSVFWNAMAIMWCHWKYSTFF